MITSTGSPGVWGLIKQHVEYFMALRAEIIRRYVAAVSKSILDSRPQSATCVGVGRTLERHIKAMTSFGNTLVSNVKRY